MKIIKELFNSNIIETKKQFSRKEVVDLCKTYFKKGIQEGCNNINLSKYKFIK